MAMLREDIPQRGHLIKSLSPAMLTAEVLAEKQAEPQSLNRNECCPSLELNDHPPEMVLLQGHGVSQRCHTAWNGREGKIHQLHRHRTAQKPENKDWGVSVRQQEPSQRKVGHQTSCFCPSESKCVQQTKW